MREPETAEEPKVEKAGDSLTVAVLEDQEQQCLMSPHWHGL
jgi:hypothetical protein